MVQFLSDFAKETGYKIACCDISVLEEMSRELDQRDADFSDILKEYTGMKKAMDFALHSNMKSIIVLCYPYFEIKKTRFHFDTKVVETVVPAGYAIGKDNAEIPRDKLDQLLKQHNIQNIDIRSSLKNLLTRIGLAQYGRNNISYVEDFGSFHSIIAVACDYELKEGEGEALREPSRMSQCDACELCIKACKSGAISKENYLIDFEKCITLHNEATEEWPRWIEPYMTRYLVGCNACQLCCPKNRGLAVQGETIDFSQEESMAIVNGVDKNNAVWETIRAKFYDIGLKHYEDALCHTIKMLYQLG